MPTGGGSGGDGSRAKLAAAHMPTRDTTLDHEHASGRHPVIHEAVTLGRTEEWLGHHTDRAGQLVEHYIDAHGNVAERRRPV